MSTSLQYLHQNLYRLKECKSMDSRRFKKLYDEAKSHEKNASLMNLVTRAKNDELSQTTDLFLILTRMLDEIKDCEENDVNFNRNLDKIYKWYTQHRKLSNSETNAKQNKYSTIQNTDRKTDKTLKRILSTSVNVGPTSAPKDMIGNVTSRTTTRHCSSRLSTSRLDKDDITVENHHIELKQKANRNLSPIYFPNLNRNNNHNVNANHGLSLLQATSQVEMESGNKNTERSSDAYQTNPANFKSIKNCSPTSVDSITDKFSLTKYTNTSFSDDDDFDKSLRLNFSNLNDNLLLTYNEFLEMEPKYINPKARFDDANRQGILKALSLYANQLYSNLDQKDTKKLENNLRSLSKFYDTLNDANISDQSKNTKKKLNNSSINMQTLIEMAKEVSDKMIISKAQTDIRMYENKLLLDTYKQDQESKVDYRNPMSGLNEIIDSGRDVDDLEVSNIDKEKKSALSYYVTIKNPHCRPKSSSYVDWRGHISRPVIEHKTSKSALKLSATSFTISNRPKTSSSINQERELTVKFEDKPKEYFPSNSDLNKTEVSSEDNNERPSKSTQSPIDEKYEQDESKFNEESRETFKKLRSRSRQSQIRSETSLSLPAQEPKEIKFISFVSKIDPYESITLMKEKSNAEQETNKNEIKNEETQSEIQCSCLLNEREDTITCPNCKEGTSSYIKSATKRDVFHLTSANDVETENESTRTDPAQVDLKEILISNYDPKFASRIGIKDFMPDQVLNATSLKFIPFEKIDGSYPKVQGHPIYDPSYNKVERKLYRTNPSIPIPESRYGSKSSVYDEIIQYKRQNIDSNALEVYQPEDVHLVRDLLNLEHKSLNEVLTVEPLIPEQSGHLVKKIDDDAKSAINTNITPMGRPINTHPIVRWRSLDIRATSENFKEKNDELMVSNKMSTIIDDNNNDLIYRTSIDDQNIMMASNRNFEYESMSYANTLKRHAFSLSDMFEGRPIPAEYEVENPIKKEEYLNRFNEVKKSVHIPTLFKGTTIQNYVKELNLEERQRKEQRRMAAIKIQKNYRQHLKDKRFIENRATVSQDAIEWAKNYKLEMLRRKLEKEKTMLEEHLVLERENAKLKSLIKRIGIHRDLYQILHKKGPEYTNKIINRAVVCVQRWVRGWLVRLRFKKFKETLIENGTTWSAFVKRYQKTVRRIMKVRGTYKSSFLFTTEEARDYFIKEKKYSSYFDKLSFAGEIDNSDIEKLFNFCDLYPSLDEIKEAKFNVFKYHKIKNTTNSITKPIALDIIYYIYPPMATKLKSTRKSTWFNPVVNGEDALRLKGSKIIEPAYFEKAWKMMSNHTLVERKKLTTPMETNEEEKK